VKEREREKGEVGGFVVWRWVGREKQRERKRDGVALFDNTGCPLITAGRR